MSIELSFFILAGVALAVALYGYWRYKTPLNPLCVFCATEIGVFTLLSGIVAAQLSGHTAYAASMPAASLISAVYVLGVLSPYLIKTPWCERVYASALNTLGLGRQTAEIRYSGVKFALMLMGFVMAFILLMVTSGGGLLWITNSRAAYTFFRLGIGPAYALSHYCLAFGLLYYIWARRLTGIKLVLITALFCFLSYFMGSKNNILTLVIGVIAYYNFKIRPVPTVFLVSFGGLFLLGALALLVLQGSYSSLIEALYYFKDYFDTTAQFLYRFDEFGYHYGGGILSNLWYYVPRIIYPDKPFEYGPLLINKVLYPGEAEGGLTRGYLPWSLSYLDFGVFGVFIDGMFIGLQQKIFYEHFLRNRTNFSSFIIMLQLTLWPIYIFTPLFYFVPLLILQSIFLRLVIVKGESTEPYQALAEPSH